MMESYLEIVLILAGFTVIALASSQVGGLFTKANLPLITGFLFTGIISGPYVLGLVSEEAVQNLRFVDELALAFIAFFAGSELYMRELKGRLKSIRWVMLGLVLSTFTFGTLAFFLLSGFIPFMREMPASGRIAVSILAGAILVARSPSSAIAVVHELRAKGAFTKTVLGVTVLMDVVVIALFGINSSIADTLLTGLPFNITFILLLVGELVMSLIAGLAVGKGLKLILSTPFNKFAKATMILLLGYAVFVASAALREESHRHLSFEVLLEPLLICMIAGFAATNFTNYRTEFSRILQDIGLPIYIAFFTLTGASLTLDVLQKTWPIALALFGVRLSAIFVGAFTGGTIAGDPMRHNRVSWMAYITQAGVGLGLAKEVVVEFPEWGPAFATVMISVIVANQIVGPPLFKWALHIVDEVHSRAKRPEYDSRHDAIIFGLEGQSFALARILGAHGWHVKVASRQAGYVEETAEGADIDIQTIPDLSLDALRKLDAGKAEAIVMMLSDDENYQICELAYEHFGTQNLIVRLNDKEHFDRFNELGALIVDPASALVSLLDHSVRSPSAASLLLGMQTNQDVLELEVRNPDLDGAAIRDMRLPLDMVILSVRRREQMLIPLGYTRLKIGDWVTVVGSLASLKQMMLRLDTNRESEVVDLVERVSPEELSTKTFETEVKEIIRKEDDVRLDRFDKLIKESVVIDIDRNVELEPFFKQVAETMSHRLRQSPDAIFESLMEREKKASTAIGPGLAIPHIIIDGEHSFSILLARCKEGIAFPGAARPVHTVFVLAGTMDERDFHLQALSNIAEMVQDSRFEKRWLRARNERALREVVLQRTGKHP
jgi:Trk K+ transport system NAD-binding subunit/mannitol/fructose-specific phosphotransferase system IIA component (Ntr-type)/Kef-type K+ transport system membrane component KefB